jgi:predicted nucleic acid-binding Zn ribbon protein
MKSSSPRPIADVIAKAIQQLGLGTKFKQHEVLDLWSQIVGEQISKVTAAESIRDGKLFVSVKHSTWRNELIFLKQELIARINKRVNQVIINDIIFR